MVTREHHLYTVWGADDGSRRNVVE